ncbi:hypothetical protein IFM89_022155 [Coptis chinensis]|uniref:Uncharacterized protein n=1 Tax=Coptis chinensis TaxID=261450 RepID=A0A835HVI3_9MAGN|nr:hypothetical protein IFM89_022155 [Coptis chinensis]
MKIQPIDCEPTESSVKPSLVCCESNLEKNVLTETVKIVEKNNKICNCKRKEECRQVVIDGLVSLGYNACICKSKWEKSSSFPSGEYVYIDVVIEGGERLILDIDFKSEFEIARSTGNYRCLLQSIPAIYVGKIDRLKEIVTIVSDAAKKSLLKKGMHVPPWRKTEYMIAKWISPYTRTSDGIESVPNKSCLIETKNFSGEFELIFSETCSNSIAVPVEEEKISVVVTPWKPPAIKPKSNQKGTKMVAGLASALKEKP